MYLTDLQRLVGRIRVDTGPRGLGKTSLLRQVQRQADARGAATIWVTAGDGPGLVTSIVSAIEDASSTWGKVARQQITSSLKEVRLKIGAPGIAEAETTFERADNSPTGVRDFERMLVQATMAVVADGKRGLVLLVDEVQAGDRHGLRSVAYAWQHFQAERADLPLALFAAGLPESPEVIGDAATFSERYRFSPLHRLDEDAARIALGRPAAQLEVTWAYEALDLAVVRAEGYPYALQLYGDAAWRAAGFPDAGGRIETSHVDAAKHEVDSDLQGLFRARWVKSTPQERVFMTTMADQGDGSVLRRHIAEAMGQDSERVGMVRGRLIDKGFIEAVGRGRLRFTVSGFAELIRDRGANEEAEL